MSDSVNRVRHATRAAAAFWACGTADVSIVDVSSNYAWAAPTAVILAVGPHRQQVLVSVTMDDQAHVLGQSDRLDRLNELFQRGQVAGPRGLSPLQLAEAIRSLLEGPGGLVGSKQLAVEEEAEIDLWTLRSSSAGPEVFRQYCRDPVLDERGDEWELAFFFFHPNGGVESWRVKGEASSVREYQKILVVPDGSFTFPYC